MFPFTVKDVSFIITEMTLSLPIANEILCGIVFLLHTWYSIIHIGKTAYVVSALQPN